MMTATDPSVRMANARSMGLLEWVTQKMRLTNSSTLMILSRCFSVCWHTRKIHKRNRFDLRMMMRGNGIIIWNSLDAVLVQVMVLGMVDAREISNRD